jgi:hypothetical protein
MFADPHVAAEVRTLLQSRIAASSVGEVARDVGIGASALARILRGGGVYASTSRRLAEWWLHESALLPRVTDAEVNHALDGLLQTVEPADRPAAMSCVADALRGLHFMQPGRCPVWVGELLRAPPGADHLLRHGG